MAPNRALPTVGTTLENAGRRITIEAGTRSILKQLASSLRSLRDIPDPLELAYLIRLDRDLDLIEHETCDCV